MSVFDIEVKQIKQFESDLKTFASRAFPFATRNTLNSAAFFAQTKAKIHVKEDMTLRNSFTLKSIIVEQTGTLRVSQQAAIVGSTADYMEDQEFGTVNIKKGKVGVRIPTSYSAGLSESARPRTRVPRGANKIKNIRLTRSSRTSKSRKQRNFLAILNAVETGQKYVFLDLSRSKGLFKVVGTKKRPRIKMVHDLSRQSVRIPRNPWLAPAVEKAQKQLPKIYLDSLIFQLKRNNLFKDV